MTVLQSELSHLCQFTRKRAGRTWMIHLKALPTTSSQVATRSSSTFFHRTSYLKMDEIDQSSPRLGQNWKSVIFFGNL